MCIIVSPFTNFVMLRKYAQNTLDRLFKKVVWSYAWHRDIFPYSLSNTCLYLLHFLVISSAYKRLAGLIKRSSQGVAMSETFLPVTVFFLVFLFFKTWLLVCWLGIWVFFQSNLNFQNLFAQNRVKTKINKIFCFLRMRMTCVTV